MRFACHITSKTLPDVQRMNGWLPTARPRISVTDDMAASRRDRHREKEVVCEKQENKARRVDAICKAHGIRKHDEKEKKNLTAAYSAFGMAQHSISQYGSSLSMTRRKMQAIRSASIVKLQRCMYYIKALRCVPCLFRTSSLVVISRCVRFQ